MFLPRVALCCALPTVACRRAGRRRASRVARRPRFVARGAWRVARGPRRAACGVRASVFVARCATRGVCCALRAVGRAGSSGAQHCAAFPPRSTAQRILALSNVMHLTFYTSARSACVSSCFCLTWLCIA
eukprot:1277691-Lingulodinium_polyedra.AAC.1